jgi:HSP20 family molecular chaperone IbpA
LQKSKINEEKIMYNDSLDVFAEMDEIFDKLFSRVSGNFGMRERGFSSPGTTLADFDEESTDEPVQAEIEEGQFREPVPEVFHDPDGTKIVVELPGVTEDNLNIAIRRGELIIEAVSGDCMYHMQTPVPNECDPSTMNHSLKNGVLEVTVCMRPDSAANVG